jgi:hypothetical protein
MTTYYDETGVVIGGTAQRYVPTGTTWSDVRNGVGTQAVANEAITELTYISGTAKWYRIKRCFLGFDTRALTGVVVSAKIRLHSILEQHRVTASLNIYGASRTDKSTVVGSDYANTGTTAFCETPIAISSIQTNTWYEFELNAAGIAAINVGGLTEFSLKYTGDAEDSAPTIWEDGIEDNQNWFEDGLDNNQPELEINSSSLSVQTDPATNISSSSAVLNGTLLDDGL